MNPRLQHLFERLEKDRVRVVELLEKIPSEQLRTAPAGKWTIHQILSHIVTGEKMSLQYMKKKVLGIRDTENTGIIEEGKMGMLWLSQRLPFKFKAPRIVVESTPDCTELAPLMEEWANERQDLKTFLEGFENDQLQKKIYKHIRAGRLNIQHALLFFREHYLHHLPQIKKLL